MVCDDDGLGGVSRGELYLIGIWGGEKFSDLRLEMDARCVVCST
jgi:hypothetical protein